MCTFIFISSLVGVGLKWFWTFAFGLKVGSLFLVAVSVSEQQFLKVVTVFSLQ